MPRPSSLVRLTALLAVVSTGALAQGTPRVVVLEFDKDTRGVVRGQVVDALADAKQVELLALRKWEDAADRKRIAPPAYTEAPTIAALGPGLGLHVVVAGEVAERFTVRIFDLKGEQVWTKELPLSRGKLSADNARRLAAAIAAAATASASATVNTPPPDTTTVPPPDTTPPNTDGTGTATVTPPPDTTVPPPATTPVTPPTVEPQTSPANSNRPPLFAGRVAGTTTLRSYCSRPGVNSCKQWDDLPDGTEPSGETVTFTSSVPYAGYQLSAEVFPLAGANGWWNGFGVTGSWSQAFSLTTVRISTPNSTTPDRTVTSIDTAWTAAAVYRFFFPMLGFPGFAGVHGGYRTRAFAVDPTAGTLLGGTSRRYPYFGIDARLPLAKLAQLELTGSYFLNPRPGDEELSKYGTSTRGLGFTAGAGLTGQVWGPLGYSVRFAYEGYWDTFTGAGTRWQNGGVSHESYAVASWGVTAAW